MDLRQSLRMGWDAIRSHKLRSALTTLGVVIGVAAVITFVTLGASLQTAVIGDVSGDQPPVVNVWTGPEDAVENGATTPGLGAQPAFTEHDLERLAELEGVRSVEPYARVPTTALEHEGDRTAREGVIAVSTAYLTDEEFRGGRTIRQGEAEAVMNPQAARAFEENVTVGSEVSITLANGSTRGVTVVGILNASASTGPFEGFSSAPRVYVPIEPFYGNTVESPSTGEPTRVYSTVTVTATDHESVPAVRERVRAYLETDSDADLLRPDGYAFAVQTNEDVVERIRSLLDRLTGFVTSIALLSLLVGSIGIANIMLVSVTERTREIGIMKAVGAQRRDILQLFLVEAAIIGVVGAVLGSLLGVVGGWAVTAWLEFPLEYPVEWFGIAVVIGFLVGVLAGLYPAWSAARLDPIESLRYE